MVKRKVGYRSDGIVKKKIYYAKQEGICIGCVKWPCNFLKSGVMNPRKERPVWCKHKEDGIIKKKTNKFERDKRNEVDDLMRKGKRYKTQHVLKSKNKVNSQKP